MKLGDVKISFPIKSYESKVTVITPRKPTVIEHQLLQTIKTLNTNPRWKNKRLNDLFEKLFMVPNPNNFVYPVLQELRRLNVVEFDDTAISNNEIAIGSIRLTKDGIEMMSRGELPSAEKEEISTDRFDLISNRIIADTGLKKLQDDFDISHAEFGNEFPNEIINDSLMSRTVSWLKKGISKIRNVEEISTDLSWVSKSCEIQLTNNGEISLTCSNSEYNEYLKGHKILEDVIGNKFNCAKSNSVNSLKFQPVSINELDESVYNIKSLDNGLNAISNSSTEMGIYDSSVQIRGKHNITIICNSNINKVQRNGNSFIVYTETENPIGNSCLFIDNKSNVFTNNVNVSINSKSYIIPISYSVKSLNKTFDEIITDLQIFLFNIPEDKVGLFFGKAGKNIKRLMEKYQCKIDVNDTGKCLVTNLLDEHVQELTEYIESYMLDIEIDQVYEGEIIEILDFGAIVKISPIFDGLIHVSELAWEYVKDINKIVSLGDNVKVKLIKIHKRKYHFSIKALLKNPNKKKKAEKTTIENASTVYVVDTNVFIDEPNLLKEFSSDEFIVVSKKVVDELDNLKQKNTEQDPARWAIKNLNKYKKDNIEFTGADLSLLPPDYHQKSPDNMILSVAIKHKMHSPVILTTDNGLRLKAKAEKIKTISLEEFLEGKNNNE